MWLIIAAISILMTLASVIYLVSRVGKFKIINTLFGSKKHTKNIVTFLLVAVISVVLYCWIDMVNMIICLIHLTVFWIICDIVAAIIHKIKPKQHFRYTAGVVAILVSVVYLLNGYYLANNVVRTEYNIKTDKQIGNVKVAMFSDSHVGTLFDGDGFAKYMQRINNENADVLVVVGDYIDDDTSREVMVDCCKALGQVKTNYGIYYVFGNHDKGYYGAEHRGYTEEDFRSELINNGVIILEDENVLIDNRFYLIGRQDKSEKYFGKDIASMDSLVDKLDNKYYSIVLDHQPGDYKNQAGKADLVLSGHTHGGQLIPIRQVGVWTGVNDATYGIESRDGTNFIVSSGLADWAIYFKTGCVSEYVIINIEGK